MGSPECTQSSVKWDTEEDIEVNIDIMRDDDGWDGDDLRKHKTRKRVGGSSRTDSDQDDYEAREDARSKQVKKNLEENTLDKLSTWYQNGEAENRHEGVNKSRSKGCSLVDEAERKKIISKYSEYAIDSEKLPDRDLRYSGRKDCVAEKGFRYGEHGKNSRRRWDDSGKAIKAGEKLEISDVKLEKPSDPKPESMGAKEQSDTADIEPTDVKSKVRESVNDNKAIRAQAREKRRGDSGNNKKERSEALEKDHKGSLTPDDGSNKEIYEENRQTRNPTGGIIDSHDKPVNGAEDASMWIKDKSRRDIESSNRDKTPEKIGKCQLESDSFDIDYEKSCMARGRVQGKDSSWDERSKERDDIWGDKSRDRDDFEDSCKKRQDKERRDGERTYKSSVDWELARRARERMDGDRPHGRSGGRKDGSRTEAVKTSSKYGISNDNYDVIEIHTKPFDCGRDYSKSLHQRNGDAVQPEIEEIAYSREEKFRDTRGSSVPSGENSKDRSTDGGDQDSWRDENHCLGPKSATPSFISGGLSSGNGSLPPQGNQEPGSYGRYASQAVRGNRTGKLGRGRHTGRENQPAGIQIPLIGSPFGPLGLPPPGSMQSLPSNMSPAPGPPISPGVFMPPFQPPMLWPGAQVIDMNMLAVPPGLPPVPLAPLGPRYLPNLGNPTSGALVFGPSGPGRGTPSNMVGPNFNSIIPEVHGQMQEKTGGWVPPSRNAPPGKAPFRGEQNDYSQNFVDTGMRPQNYIRELELTSVVEDYPKLRDLIQRKDEIVANSASPPMYYKCDLKTQVLSPEFFGTKFDVILIDPPWEEYAHRAPAVSDHMEHWTLEEIMDLKIEAIADTPSFIFLWVGDGVGLKQGRQCLKKWGFRRCEDICWVKTNKNKTNATPGLRHDSHTLFQRSKEHCLMGIKGTVRRSTDGHIIHANIDTDVIIAEEPPSGSTAKPEDMYRIVEHFALGRRRLELFGGDHNIRSGWLTVGKGLSSSNFNSEACKKNFTDKDGKVWAGGGGRNPPPEASHLVLTTPEIESLRPKSPMKNQQQQSAPISLTTANSSNKRSTGNSPQNYNTPGMNQEVSSSTIPSPVPWMETMKGRESGQLPSDDGRMYGYNVPFVSGSGDFLDYESLRGMNVL